MTLHHDFRPEGARIQLLMLADDIRRWSKELLEINAKLRPDPGGDRGAELERDICAAQHEIIAKASALLGMSWTAVQEVLDA